MNVGDITLAILAGGEGRRMGRPKALLTIDGRAILDVLCERFAWPGPTMLVTAPGREHPPAAERFDREVVDDVAGEGPLRGIFTAISNITTDTVVVTTVDMPLVERAHLEWLVAQLASRPDALALFLRRRDDARIEPFPSVFRMSAIEIVRRRLEARQLAMHAMAQEPGVETIEASASWEPQAWTNLNSPEDVARFSSLK